MKHIKLKPVLPIKVHAELKKARSLLLQDRGRLLAFLKENGWPDNTKKIRDALKAISNENGTFKLTFRLSPIDLVLIWGAPNGRYIKFVEPTSIRMKFSRHKYAAPNRRFKTVFGSPCPVEYLMTYDFIEKSSSLYMEDFAFSSEYYNYMSFGITYWLFDDATIPGTALICCKYSHHDLNYVPYAAYGCDAVTYGLLYDYHLRQYLVSAYEDAGIYPYQNMFEPLINEFIGIWKYSADDFSFPSSTSELFDYLQESCTEIYEEINSLRHHVNGCFLASYLRRNPIHSGLLSRHDRLRYLRNSSVMPKRAERQQELLHKKYHSCYIFHHTIPSIPIQHVHLGMSDNGYIDQIVECVATSAEIYLTTCSRGSRNYLDSFEWGRLKKIYENPVSVDVFRSLKLREFLNQKRSQMKVDKSIINNMIGDALDEAYTFAKQKALLGADGYAFMFANIFWENDADGSLSRKAAELLLDVSDTLCPMHIKETARLHAKVRFDETIPWYTPTCAMHW